MAERKSKGEKLPSVKSVRLRARSLSRLFLSLSLSFLACTRAFLSSKVALSENLSQIHQNCGREGNETRLLMREKDFEREKGEPKKAEPKKKQEREREREKQNDFFSLAMRVFSARQTFKRTILFARRSLFLAHHTFLSLKVSLSVSLSLSVSSLRRTHFSVWEF